MFSVDVECKDCPMDNAIGYGIGEEQVILGASLLAQG